MKYITADDYVWDDLWPGDSIVVPRYVVLESATEDCSLRNFTNEQVLVLANIVEKPYNGFTYVRIYLLSRQGVFFVKCLPTEQRSPKK